MTRSASLLLALLALAPAAAAQLDLGFSDGVLGQDLVFELEGDPLMGYIVVPSFNAGPTPLALFDPLDPRVLDVGLDLAAYAQTGLIFPSGLATAQIRLPALASLAGIPLRAQAVTVPGATTLVDDISNVIELRLAFEGQTWPMLSPVVEERRFMSLTTLLDGRVLVCGGHKAGDPANPTASCEIFDPSTQTAAATGGLVGARARHTATLLQDGRVLLLGGLGPGGAPTASAEVWDPATETSALVPSMAVPRVWHTATLLANGRVLVVGGTPAFTLGHPLGYPACVSTAHATTERFDPAGGGTWSPGPALPAPLLGHESTLLPAGSVLVVGGVRVPLIGLPTVTAACHRVSSVLNPAASLPAPRAFHGQGDKEDGVYVVGGATIDFATTAVSVKDSTYLYDAPSDTWSAAPQRLGCRDVPAHPVRAWRAAGSLRDDGAADVVRGRRARDPRPLDRRGNGPRRALRRRRGLHGLVGGGDADEAAARRGRGGHRRGQAAARVRRRAAR